LPRVSVIIATYNRSDVLRCAVATVQFQTLADWELIVVGDECTDETASVMREFKDPRIRFVNIPENLGEQSGPANRGFEIAQGDLKPISITTISGFPITWTLWPDTWTTRKQTSSIPYV